MWKNAGDIKATSQNKKRHNFNCTFTKEEKLPSDSRGNFDGKFTFLCWVNLRVFVVVCAMKELLNYYKW